MLLIGSVLCPATKIKHVVFVFRGAHAANGMPLLEPMRSPWIGFRVESGEAPKPGAFLDCTAVDVAERFGPDVVHTLKLVCGKTTLVVEGIEF